MYLDLVVPVGTNTDEPAPVMLYFFFGGFAAGSRDSINCKAPCGQPQPGMEYMLPADALLERGIAVATVDYRLCTEEPSTVWPGQLDDAKEAVRFLRKTAADYGIDGARIGCFGFSAGAGLCSALAVTNGWPRAPGKHADHHSAISVGVSIDGWVDWKLQEESPEYIAEAANYVPVCSTFGKDTYDKISASGRLGLPLKQLFPEPEQQKQLANASLVHAVHVRPPNALHPAPLFLTVGTKDPIHPLPPMQALATALREINAVVETVASEGIGHSACHDATENAKALEFVATHLKSSR